MIEATLVLIKPDGVMRGLIGEIIKRFEQRGLKIAGLKMVRVDEDFAKQHYIEHVDKDFYKSLEEFITSGPVVAMAIEGVDAVELVRKVVGATEPKSALPGTIRGDYAHVSYAYADKKKISIKNLVHASGNKEDAERELNLWFSIEELHSYPNVHELHTM
ncbi:nucleoside-diphosphate kinase [Candidatus Woesearchaeota archaeon]|nr:MAG: nucleoside-diphosphate kinase [Candidatus Woesearchaeota archaeon]